MYQFSVPMPYKKKEIDKLSEINNSVEKSKITSLYFSLPSSNELFTGFEQPRNMILNITKFAYWKYLLSHSLNKGFDIIYCFNSPGNIQIQNDKFPKKLEILQKLLFELEKIGINKLRVANPKLLSYLNKYYSQFILYGSTASDYKIIQEFQNLKEIHPYIKQIVPSHNINKNFKLLKNLIKLNFDIEIMLNEGCIQGCSNRFEHETELIDCNLKNYDKFGYFPIDFCRKNCAKLELQNPFIYISKGNHIYPWEIHEYSKIGINKFKLTGRDGILDVSQSYLLTNLCKTYLKGIDNIKNIENMRIVDFIGTLAGKEKLYNLKVKDIKNHLPNINHFKNRGEFCASSCFVKCKYCYKCAEKIQKVFEKKQKELQKRSIPVCIMNK